MPVGKKSRDKGARSERNIVNSLKARGIPAERVPLSGAMHGRFGGDIDIKGYRLEVKCRADGFKQIYGWIEGSDALVIMADRKEPLIVMPLSMWKGIEANEHRSTELGLQAKSTAE